MLPDICPCGSQNKFTSCCGRYLQEGQAAPDPETLMRSRYSAFCLNDLSYLKKTWHPDTYPEDLADDEASDWIGLEIIDTSIEGDEGEVEFRAKLIFDNKLEILHEISQFDKIEGIWLYHSGEFEGEEAAVKKISKTEPCPCGSGKIFKNCHFKA